MKPSRAALLLAASSLGAGLVLAYVPDCGHGFVKDDFRWIVESHVTNVHDLERLLLSDNGFYRPVVSLTFAADEWLFKDWARGYALTNFAILVLCCVALFALGRGLEDGARRCAFRRRTLGPQSSRHQRTRDVDQRPYVRISRRSSRSWWPGPW